MQEDEGLALRRRPPGVMSNRPELRWLKTVVERASHGSGGDREAEREQSADDVSKHAADLRAGSVEWVQGDPIVSLAERSVAHPVAEASWPSQRYPMVTVRVRSGRGVVGSSRQGRSMVDELIVGAPS